MTTRPGAHEGQVKTRRHIARAINSAILVPFLGIGLWAIPSSAATNQNPVARVIVTIRNSGPYSSTLTATLHTSGSSTTPRGDIVVGGLVSSKFGSNFENLCRVRVTHAGNYTCKYNPATLVNGFSQVITEYRGNYRCEDASALCENMTDVDPKTSFLDVSCPAARNCMAVGVLGDSQPFIASEVRGTWGKAQLLDMTLGLAGTAGVTAISCFNETTCTVGGDQYNGNYQAFVASEVNGVWGPTQQVAANLTSDDISVTAIQCNDINNCLVAGTTIATNQQAFVASEVNGVWGPAQLVATNLGDVATPTIGLAACPTATNCAVGGSYYVLASRSSKAFVESEAAGVWGLAIVLPKVPHVLSSQLDSLSCTSGGNCKASGIYNKTKVFTTKEISGGW